MRGSPTNNQLIPEISAIFEVENIGQLHTPGKRSITTQNTMNRINITTERSNTNMVQKCKMNITKITPMNETTMINMHMDKKTTIAIRKGAQLSLKRRKRHSIGSVIRVNPNMGESQGLRKMAAVSIDLVRILMKYTIRRVRGRLRRKARLRGGKRWCISGNYKLRRSQQHIEQ